MTGYEILQFYLLMLGSGSLVGFVWVVLMSFARI